jgi:Fe-S cluster biogenesis protein NfuA
MTLSAVVTSVMSVEAIERRTRNYLSNNVPQIHEHGGHFQVEDVDEERGEVTVAIGGACSGCGIAPMTMKAIRQRLPAEVDGVSNVTVRRAGGPRAAVMPSKIDEMEEMDEYADYDPPF